MKQLFFDLLDYDLPDSVVLFATTPIPDVADVPLPQTVDDAIICEGIFCSNLNTILQSFVGLCPVELLLRIGSRNPQLKALVAASYELFGELAPERISEILFVLIRVQSRAGSLIGTGVLPTKDRAQLQIASQQVSTQISRDSDPIRKGFLEQIKDALDQCLDAADETVEALDLTLQYLIDKIEILKDYANPQRNPMA